MKDVKNVLELVEGVKELLLIGKAVLKDGKVDFSDLAALSKLLEKQALLVAAFADLKEIPAEAKDISLDEAREVVVAIIDAAKAVKAA